MQTSHAVVRQEYVGFAWSLILAFLVNVPGFCCLFVGLLVTISVPSRRSRIAYRECVGFELGSFNVDRFVEDAPPND